MGKSKSKSKGNAGEAALCRIMKDIFGGSWQRVPNSGAFVGGKNAFRKTDMSVTQTRASKGDIIPPDFMPKLVLEAKFYKDFRFHQLLQPGSCTQLDEWIGQALDAVDHGDVWFVAFKINLRGWYVAIPYNATATSYALDNHSSYKGDHGQFIVTEAISFFTLNKDLLLEQCR